MPTTHLAQTGVLDLISQAGLVAKLILILLFSASLICWAVIFSKWKSLTIALEQNEKFYYLFWAGKDLDEIVKKTEFLDASPAAATFRYALKEVRRLSLSKTQDSVISNKMENIQRALFRSSSQEISGLEKNLGWLATTASAAPFLGLFGTVWGIMNSFQSIGASGAANLAIVAPGISEALITTATGIGAAIPAVIAYNHFIGKIRKISLDLECFCQDFVNIIQRSLLSGDKEN